MRDAVEVAFQIGVHHITVATLDEKVHLAQGILARPPRPEAITRRMEHNLEHRLDDELDRHLHDPVLDRRDAQRPRCTVALRDFHPPDRQRPVLSCLEAFRKLGQIVPGTRFEPLDALSIHARRPAIGPYFLPGRLKGLRRVHLVYQTVPAASFDAVNQRRYHTLRPNPGFHPAQVRHLVPLGFCALFSHFRHFRRCSLPVSVHRASTFLPPLPRSGFAARPSHGLRRSGTMRALTPASLAHTRQVSPLTPPCLQDIQSPTTPCARTSLYQSYRLRLIDLGCRGDSRRELKQL